MANKISWEPLPELRGKISKNTRVIFKNYSPTDTDYTCVIENPRNLDTNPLTNAEMYNRMVFALAAYKIKTMSDEDNAAMVAAFAQQSKYKTLYGFKQASVIAKIKSDYTNLTITKEDQYMLYVIGGTLFGDKKVSAIAGPDFPVKFSA